MTSLEIRHKFITFFNKKNHKEFKSSSLIPHNDPTLLFTNAGMNPFKNIFLGIEKTEHNRIVSVQKCVRAGGKHNDLDNVGHTARHHTFFEMLGNFSFGDYFKKEAIAWSWEFLTQTLGLDKSKLYISVFKDDKETYEIWNKQEKIPKDKIFYFGEKDNFWRMGDTGPCGPCTEIYYDLGSEHFSGPDQVVGGEGDRFVEVWNLVFMQYFEKNNTLTDLKKPCVDTGMGLERLSSILQGQTNNYHTDIFSPLLKKISQISGKQYHKNLADFSCLKERKNQKQINASFCVLADHIRATSFLIQDGVMPKSDGRGYVLRRIMRRAIRFASLLSDDKNLFSSLSTSLIDSMQNIYPELKVQQQHILNTIKTEEAQFLKTLDQGLFLLEAEIKKMSNKGINILDGKQAFKLYDTYGFPIDLSSLILQEKGLSLDKISFEKELLKAKELSKKSGKTKGLLVEQNYLTSVSSKILSEHGKTESLVDSKNNCQASVLYLSNGTKEVDSLKNTEEGFIILDKSCVYPEGGGQISDSAICESLDSKSNLKLKITHCKKEQDIFIHFVKIKEGLVLNKDKINITLDKDVRKAVEKNHSATHLLHSALKTVLGDHVNQSGSLVTDKKLRFDFSHNKSLSVDEIKSIEKIINYEISLCSPSVAQTSLYEDAIKNGITALFGEKYTDKVKSIKLGSTSHELCGGTHVKNTGEIQFFKILSESSLSSGIRRIEAVTGYRAIEFANNNILENKSIKQLLNISDEDSLLENIKKLKQDNKKLSKKNKDYDHAKIDIKSILEKAEKIKIKNIEFSLIMEQIAVGEKEVLKKLTDQLRDKLKTALIILVDNKDLSKNKTIVIGLTKDLTLELNAGNILKKLSAKMGGRGGGRADFAQGSIENLENFNSIKKEITSYF
ncbi:MAG: alanine--tRNA ligase [Bdellovibrionales bacterium]|nr:alanine--tRNA ligase [Bdellovibrionales bacterium]